MLFLNELRHQTGTAMKLSLPLATPKLLAAQILRGEVKPGDLVEGEDYRGVPAFGVARPIQGTDWIMLSKLDRSELYAEAITGMSWIGLAGFLAWLTLFAGHYLLRQRQQLSANLSMREAELERLRALRLLTAIADTSSDAIFAKDLEGRYVLFNPAAARLTGTTQEEVLGRDDTSLFPPNQAARIMASDMRVMQEDRGTTFQETLSTPDGKATFLATTGPLHDDEGKVTGVYGIARDITEISRAEEALRASEETYRSLFDNMLNGFAYCQMLYEEGQPSDFIYLKVNPAFETLTGLKDVVGRKVSEVIPGIRETDPELMERYGRVARSGQPERFEQFVTALQMWFSILVYSPQADHFVAVFDVITDRKRAEFELSRERGLLKSLIQTLPDLIWLKDPAGVYLTCNPRFEAFLGASEEEIVGRTDYDFVDRELADFFREKDQLAMETGGPSVNEEKLVFASDGHSEVVQTIKTPMHDINGALLGVLGIGRDITERKQHEIQLALEASRSRALLNLPKAAEDMDERTFMQHGLEQAEQLTGSRIAFIHFVNDDQETIELAAWSHDTLEHYCHAAYDNHYPISQAGIWADALRRRAPVMVNDYASAPDKHGLPEGHAELNRLISVPVIEGGLVRMMAGVGNKPEPYTDMDVETVQLIADRIWRIVRQHRADEKLLASESRYRRLFEAAKDGVLILDAETGMVVDVNPFLVKLLGYSHEEFLGRHIWDLGSLRNVVASKESFQVLQQHEYQRYEDMPLVTATGKEISVEFVSNVYEVDHTRVIQCNIRDITDRKHAQNALKRSNDVLQSVVENVPLRIFWKDLDLRYLGCNTAFAKDAGRSIPDEVIGETDFQMGWKDQAELYRADDKHVMESGIPRIGIEEPQTTPDGDTIWIRTSKVPLRDDGNRVIGVLGIYEDITSRIQGELTLRKLALAVQQSPESIVITNLDAEIEYVNEAFQRATGYSAEEVIGQNPRILHSGKTPRETYDAMWERADSGTPMERRIHQ